MGVHSRPMRKDMEKFRVASVDRNRPRRRREKDFTRRYCWDVGLKRCCINAEIAIGNWVFSNAKTVAAAPRYLAVLVLSVRMRKF